MLWLGISVLAVAGIVAVMAVMLGKRSNVAQLGSVSDRWIASHRIDVP